MNVNGIRSSKIIEFYNNEKKVQHKSDKIQTGDSLQISKMGKNLSSFYIDDVEEMLEKKVKSIKERIDKGTYKVDSELIAKKMLDIMKGRDI